ISATWQARRRATAAALPAPAQVLVQLLLQVDEALVARGVKGDVAQDRRDHERTNFRRLPARAGARRALMVHLGGPPNVRPSSTATSRRGTVAPTTYGLLHQHPLPAAHAGLARAVHGRRELDRVQK